MKMYFECKDWLGEHWLCKVNIFKGIILLLFGNGHLIQVKHISKKNIIFD